MNKQYTTIIRKSKLEYVAICLELNISARGESISEVENNLKEAIDLYLEDIKENPETKVSMISIEEFIEFLNDTIPDRIQATNSIFKTLEIHEVPSYA
jgi:predicted RNase H-like HicB family nuclease